ncbi:hypothetical protein SLA2020_070100 [Shorea laevis]
MEKESIPWTAFTCLEGHFEWQVMLFGLKNAPSIFQRKMDQIFKKYSDFVLVYIDDILVFSKTETEHIKHLQVVFTEFLKNGLIISKKKMELSKEYIEFLGMRIGQGKIQLQDHIVKKILDFPDKIEETKELQKFLGILNYARMYIKDLSKLTGPLYGKPSPKGRKFFNSEDVRLVKRIKDEVKNLPSLTLPLESDYKIVETDSSSEGWGAIL